MKEIYIGIDYSLTGPAMCIMYDCCNFEFLYLTDKAKKYIGEFYDSRIIGMQFPVWADNFERFDKLSDVFIQRILQLKKRNTIKVCIEGYSMGSGSSGRVFDIAECTGILKYKLYKNNINFTPIAPTSIKKFATDNGRADKDMMYESFLSETAIDLRKEFDYTLKKINSPLSDIVDSYFMAKYSRERL